MTDNKESKMKRFVITKKIMIKIYIRVIFIIVTIIIVCSCSTTHQSNAFFSIYESIDNGVSSPMFITQKNR